MANIWEGLTNTIGLVTKPIGQALNGISTGLTNNAGLINLAGAALKYKGTKDTMQTKKDLGIMQAMQTKEYNDKMFGLASQQAAWDEAERQRQINKENTAAKTIEDTGTSAWLANKNKKKYTPITGLIGN